MSNSWSDFEIEFLVGNYKTKTYKEIGKILNRTEDAISSKCQKLKLNKDEATCWTEEEFICFLKDNGYEENYTYVDGFKTINSRVKMLHNKCGKIWNPRASYIIYRKSECEYCSQTRLKTLDEFLILLNNKNKNISLISKYVAYSSIMDFKCSMCGLEWSQKGHNLIEHSVGCPNCDGRNYSKKEPEVLINMILDINPNIIILETPTHKKKKIKLECSIDGYVWESSPDSLIRGAGCPRCSNVERYSTNVFKQKVFDKNPNIEILGEYTSHYGKIECRCSIDGFVWHPTPHTIFMGSGCPVCKTSKGESFVKKVLERENISFETQYSFSDLFGFKEKLKFDFAIFSKKDYSLICLIEVDGENHRNPIKYSDKTTDKESLRKFNLIKLYDKKKNEYCKKNKIPLFRISYNSKNIKSLSEDIENIVLEGGEKWKK